MKDITQKDVEQYAKWVLNDCMSPQDEIEWLVTTILNSDDADFDLIQTQNAIEEVITAIRIQKILENESRI